MPGRKKESAEMLEFKKKSHKTKRELEERRSGRFYLGGSIFVEPNYVADNVVAHEKWVWLINLYKKSKKFKNHITNANTDQIATYCILYANQVEIINNLSTPECTGIIRSALTNSLIKTSVELNKLGKDLLLDYFSAAKVVAPEGHKKKVDPKTKSMFGES